MGGGGGGECRAHVEVGGGKEEVLFLRVKKRERKIHHNFHQEKREEIPERNFQFSEPDKEKKREKATQFAFRKKGQTEGDPHAKRGGEKKGEKKGKIHCGDKKKSREF